MFLPKFNYKRPGTVQETLDLLDMYRENAGILAGGTDLLVRMKKGLYKPEVLISLKALKELSYIKADDGMIKIGAATPIADIVASGTIRAKAAALKTACEKTGAVSIQHYRGTIGGNILQGNRCHHYNQSEFHRSGRQPCHKDGGKICYAREDADRCYSTCQSDGGTALMALGAELLLARKGDDRTVPLKQFYTSDGISPFSMESHELLKEIIIPVTGAFSSYQRLAFRAAIDFPVVCCGVSLVPSITQKGRIKEAAIVVGAMGRSPLFLAGESAMLEGKAFSDKDIFKKAAEASMNSASTFAVHNAGAPLEYRCQMVAVLVLRALETAAAATMG